MASHVKAAHAHRMIAGIITEAPQTPLSHVNLKAQQNDTPNLYMKDASTKPEVAARRTTSECHGSVRSSVLRRVVLRVAVRRFSTDERTHPWHRTLTHVPSSPPPT